jgi:hypothetical protein
MALVVGLMAALLSVQGAAAQIAIGAVIGANNTGISGDNPDKTSYSAKTGAIAGLVLEIPVAKGVAIVFQPGYRQLKAVIGFEVDGQDEPVDSLDVKLAYVSIPVLLKVVTNGGKWYVTSGLDFGFLSSATLSTISGSAESDIKDLLTDFDVAVIFGVGRMFPVGRPKITAELRYSQSLVNLSNQTIGGSDLPVRFRASGLQLMAGVLLPLGGAR